MSFLIVSKTFYNFSRAFHEFSMFLEHSLNFLEISRTLHEFSTPEFIETFQTLLEHD